MIGVIKSFLAALVIVLELVRRKDAEKTGETRVLLRQIEDENEKWKNRRVIDQDVDRLAAADLERELRATADAKR